MRGFLRTCFTASLLAAGASATFAAFPPSAGYPAAVEDPVVDGSFTTAKEYLAANRVLDDLGVGWFFKEHRQNWTAKGVTYPNTITFFDTHYFTDSRYGQADLYDMNGWELAWGDIAIEVWVFLAGDHPDPWDYQWLDLSGIGAANYPSGFNDDGGFLVRLNYDPSTDRHWLPGDPEPGDPDWKFEDYYGVFAKAGFDSSAFGNRYSTIQPAREIYEWSVTMNMAAGGAGGGIPGVPQFGGGLGGDPGRGGGGGGTGMDDDEANPGALPPCFTRWEKVTKWKKVKDWNPSMGGFGVRGGPGWVPNGTEWAPMGWDDSMHPKPREAVVPDVEPIGEGEVIGDGEVTPIGH